MRLSPSGVREIWAQQRALRFRKRGVLAVAYEERFRAMIAALPLPDEVDQTLLRLTLFGALNWTRVWYQPGRKTPAEIARHLVHTVMRQSLDLTPSRIASLAAA